MGKPRKLEALKREEGIALVFAVLAATVILGALALVTFRVQTAKRMADEAVLRSTLEETAKAGIDTAVQRIWNQYVVNQGNTTGNLASYRSFANANVAQVNEDLDHNGRKNDKEYDMNGNGVFDIAAPTTLVQAKAPITLASGGIIRNLTLERTDTVNSVDYTFTCTAERSGIQRTVSQTVQVTGPLFRGFDFGIMANNINCIICHARFMSLNLNLNLANPSTYGTFDRIKLACLESLMLRDIPTEKIGTTISGTTYTRGVVKNQAGVTLTAAQIAGNVDIKAHQFSTTNGKLTQSSSGALTKTTLTNAGTDSNGLPKQFANLYMNYPADATKMTDGDVPNNFPAPFPDENGNRVVDASEFSAVVNAANGAIKGGIAYGVPKGSTYTGTALPTSSNNALSSLAGGAYQGNVILVGTTDHPIEIDDTVAIDGDLVIQGVVKGMGRLLVKGNVYVTGDVTYADAAGSFGVADDGTSNGLALISGGSIMMGDYLTIRGKNNSKDSQKFPDKAGSIDMRSTTLNKSLTSGSTTETVKIGYKDQVAGDPVIDPGTGSGNKSQYSFTTSELMLFNRMEYSKAQANSSYKPRYYRIRDSQPIYTYTASDEHAVKYSDTGVATITNTTGATIQSLSPDAYWISEGTLRNIWYADEMTRPSSGRAFKFDGLLYSNNAIFCITRSKGRHNSYTYGNMIVRGSVVAADLGVLAAGEEANGDARINCFDLYYDPRVSSFMRVVDTSQVQFKRLAYRYD